MSSFKPVSPKTKQLIVNWPEYLSYDKSDDEVRNYYSGNKPATDRRESFFYDKRLIDIFLYAMALGKKSERRQKLKDRSQSIPKYSFQEEEIWVMMATAMDEPDFDLPMLENPKHVTTVCEEYANAGIKDLIRLDRRFIDDRQEHFAAELKKLIDGLD